MNDATVKTWWSRELAEHLGIGGSTLRKWSLELEKAGYIFLRDELGRRAYVEHDALALRQLKKALDSGKSYESATNAVVAEYLRQDGTSITLSAISQEPSADERYEALKEQIDEQGVQIAQLIEINRSLIQRLDERDRALSQLTESIAAQKAITAAGDDRLALMQGQLESERAQREKEHAEYLMAIEQMNGKQSADIGTLLREIVEAKSQAAAAAEAANRSIFSKLFGKK